MCGSPDRSTEEKTSRGSMKGKTALVIDDHPITHFACSRILETMGYARILAARNIDDASRIVRRETPDFVVLDLGLAGEDGLLLLERLRRWLPDARILVFTMHEIPALAAAALRAGASGFLTKSADPDLFVEAVTVIERGGVFIEHRLATRLAVAAATGESDPTSRLTPREFQVLKLMAGGRSLGEIADELALSYKTVANTAMSIRRKLGFRNQAELLRFAIEHRLG